MSRRSPLVLMMISGLAQAEDPNDGSARSLLAVPLESSRGEVFRLEAFADKPLVLFYEDRGSSADNQQLKDTLFALGRERGLLGAVAVVGVANLGAWNWPPARQFAQAGVAEAEAKAGVPVLIDWKGSLTRAPLSLSDRASTVLLVHQGEVLFRHAGPLSVNDRARFLATLSSTLDELEARR